MFSADSLEMNWIRPPATRLHALCVVARQAHPAHHIDLEEGLPVRIINVEEGLDAVDTHFVHQDVGIRLGIEQRLATGGRAQVGDHATGLRARPGGSQLRQCRVDTFLLTTVDDDGRAGICQPLGDGEADAASGTRYDGGTRAAAAEFVFIVGITTIWGVTAYSLGASLAHLLPKCRGSARGWLNAWVQNANASPRIACTSKAGCLTQLYSQKLCRLRRTCYDERVDVEFKLQ